MADKHRQQALRYLREAKKERGARYVIHGAISRLAIDDNGDSWGVWDIGRDIATVYHDRERAIAAIIAWLERNEAHADAIVRGAKG